MGKLTNSYNLKKINPKLAKQWHPTKNGNLTPKDFKYFCLNEADNLITFPAEHRYQNTFP
jgi:hypothetical protein